ncbi:MAG: hypothetical protein IJ753_08160 [Bacteroidales bacterium]|jgi:hypothetical protein|nr:hypothetical protein [Bacteroidales bacterium]MBR3730921.1 hypothetical protein [Bacteroidales bacterium]
MKNQDKKAKLTPEQKEINRLREEVRYLRSKLQQKEEEQRRRREEVVNEGVDDIKKKLMAGGMNERSADVLSLLMSKDTDTKK